MGRPQAHADLPNRQRSQNDVNDWLRAHHARKLQAGPDRAHQGAPSESKSFTSQKPSMHTTVFHQHGQPSAAALEHFHVQVHPQRTWSSLLPSLQQRMQRRCLLRHASMLARSLLVERFRAGRHSPNHPRRTSRLQDRQPPSHRRARWRRPKPKSTPGHVPMPPPRKWRSQTRGMCCTKTLPRGVPSQMLLCFDGQTPCNTPCSRWCVLQSSALLHGMCLLCTLRGPSAKCELGARRPTPARAQPDASPLSTDAVV